MLQQMEVLKQSQQNNFDHLPDDIVLLILNKLWEAKWICRCLIGSKRFASLISHINNVSVKSPHYVSTWLEQEKGSTSVFDYLVGLKDIVYLHLEERFFREVGLESSWLPILKWKICDFDINVKSFIFVKASWLERVELPLAKDEKDEEEEEGEEEEDEYMQLHPTNIAVVCFDDACMRLNIVMDMIEKHQMLRSITISDIKNQGKIVVSGNQISELRDLERAKLLMTEVDSGRAELLLKYCHLPSLHLPKSKFMMGCLSLVYIRCVNPSSDDEGDDVNDDDMSAGSFDGEGEAFNEAVKEILAKHKSKLNTVAAAAQN
ncbi:hypothetical protein RHMOL_Rhmol02G0302100 [Rhododendron molle]|uniref:Uncharacterized protein n=1 Tax=Rhododendron molle TaxID=49168 RepID=A0ACC0PWB6_RHOML|nr:hypothetical protein RHMOL_Rhmol02G0302100 [Rhododendron molle]